MEALNFLVPLPGVRHGKWDALFTSQGANWFISPTSEVEALEEFYYGEIWFSAVEGGRKWKDAQIVTCFVPEVLCALYLEIPIGK